MSKPKLKLKPKLVKRKAKAKTKVKAKTKAKTKAQISEERKVARVKAKSGKRSTVRKTKKPAKRPKRPSKTKAKAKVKVKRSTKAKVKVKVKSRKKRAVKKVFERRPRKPQSFEVVEPEKGATTQDEAFATIMARLEDAKAALPEGFKATIRVHPYADGSVDGELQIKVPETSRTGDTSWELMDSFGAITLGQRYWVSVGANYIIEADEQVYRRFRGMNLVQTNYQRAVKANIVEEGMILRRTILPGMARKHKHEAHSVFIRLHWNPANEHPKR